MNALLEIENLNTGYNGVSVVRGLNLSVNPGEVVALLGPNGAGKTTTLLTASGLVPIISGDVKVFGKSVQGRRPHMIAREGLAHVPEGRRIFPSTPIHHGFHMMGWKETQIVTRSYIVSAVAVVIALVTLKIR